jgi:hypothetical protein
VPPRERRRIVFTLQIFTEILVIGALILLGALPILLLLDKQSLRKGRVLPFIDHFDSKLPVTFVLLVVAYALGAAGNRLVDSAWDQIKYPIDEQNPLRGDWETNEKLYNKRLLEFLARKQPVQLQGVLPSQDGAAAGSGRIDCDENRVGKVNCIKVAEFALRERSESTREWLDNRRTYIRIMRSASFSSLLFIVSMFLYNRLARRLGKKKKKLPEGQEMPSRDLSKAPDEVSTETPIRLKKSRYKGRHFIAASLLFFAFSWANIIADEKYWQRVYELYVSLPPPAKIPK